jgi:hypothetical protein
MLVPVRLAGEQDDLALTTRDGQNGTHGLESLWVGVPECVVDDQGDPTVGSHDRRAREPRDQRELLLGADAQALERDRATVKGATDDGKIQVVKLHGEV